jgi:hypothetical protein
MPLSSVNASLSADPKNPRYWRPDLEPEDSQAVVTTVRTHMQDSRTSSQEDLYPKESATFFHGVNVQRTFYVSEDSS